MLLTLRRKILHDDNCWLTAHRSVVPGLWFCSFSRATLSLLEIVLEAPARDLHAAHAQDFPRRWQSIRTLIYTRQYPSGQNIENRDSEAHWPLHIEGNYQGRGSDRMACHETLRQHA